jgi:hypothetical protein
MTMIDNSIFTNAALSTWKTKTKCHRCLSASKPPGPILEPTSWQRLAKKHEALCAKCVNARARKRGITLTFEDLLPCVFNLEAGWFDLFLKAEPSEKEVLPNRAYAWQHAMLVSSAQMRGGEERAAQALANVGKVLAHDARGLELREAPEGGVYGWDEIDWADGERYLKVYQPSGEPIEILIHLQGEGNARLKEIIAPLGPNSLGIRKARSIFRLLKTAYPNIEILSGYRSTGARLCRPEEMKSTLSRIAGTADRKSS